MALASGLVPPALAAVDPYSWIRAGEAGSPFTDSSGKNHNFNAAFSNGAPGTSGGNPAAVIEPTGVGGPLGGTGATSTSSTRWGYYHAQNAGMWIQGQGGNGSVPGCDLFCLPPTNWVVECWVLPVGTGGSAGHAGSQFVGTGSGQFGGTPGGIAFRSQYNPGADTVDLRLDSIGPAQANNFTIGTPVTVDKTRWTHLAAVNDNGIVTFYVNGVAHGDPSPTGDPTKVVTAPSGAPYIGSGQDTGAPFDGYLDEIRYSTFAPGAFAISDLLLVPAGPNIVSQPESAGVWDGGAAPFNVQTVIDANTTYLWSRDGFELFSETGPELFLPTVSAADSNAVFNVKVSSGGVDVTSSNATLTVVPQQTGNVNYYRQAINAEASLKAFFPVDGDTGGTLDNTVDANFNGTLQNNASYDGRTNRSFGERALRFKGDSDVTIPNTPDYEFPSGSGTIEAIVYLTPATIPLGYETIFSLASSSTSAYYQFQANPGGTSLAYKDDSLSAPLIWPIPVSILGRRTHVALVFSPGTVTAYADGESLGTQVHTNFGAAVGLQANIGSSGTPDPLNPGFWNGTIDELAIYGSALSANTLAVHNSRLIYGTAAPAPTIVSVPAGTKTLFAGGAPVFRVKATGAAPLSYQWKRNGVAITGNPSATTPNLALNPSTVALSGSYSVTVFNDVAPVTSTPFTVNFIAPPDTYTSYVMADNPTAFWRMNESSGTALIDSASGLDGAYEGGFNLGVPAFSGAGANAAHFNGANGRAIVPLSANLNPNAPFSIELWGQLDNNNGNKVALSSLDRPSRGAGYEFYMGGNYTGWEFHTGGGGNYDALTGDSMKQPVGPWYHIVGIYTGTNVLLYVNSQRGNVVDGQEINNPPFTPNTAKPLYIGSRSDNAVWWPGAIADVAFYSHILTPEQIEHHFSVSYFASAITTQPADVNALQPTTVTLSAVVTGFPNTYQWFKGGVALDGSTTNLDGTTHYPGGVNSTTLSISQSKPDDSGLYHLQVTNPVGGSVTRDANVTVSPDVTAPVPLSAGSLDGISVDICFNEKVDPRAADNNGTALDIFNYDINGPGGASGAASAVLLPDGKTVRLTGVGPALTGAFTVHIINVEDLFGNAITSATVAGGVLSLADSTMGNNPHGQYYDCGLGIISVDAGGQDVWGARDGVNFLSQQVSGDFDYMVHVLSVTQPNNRDGLMVRQSLDADSAMVAELAQGDQDPAQTKVGPFFRPTQGADMNGNNQASGGWVPPHGDWDHSYLLPNVWLRIQRMGNTFAFFKSRDGKAWVNDGSQVVAMTDPVYVGLATDNGGNTTSLTHVQYSNFGQTPVLYLVHAAGNSLTLSWTSGTLQSATSINGPWTDATNQSNPQTIPSGATKFFRLRR